MRTASDAAVVLALKGGASALQFLLLVLTARWFGVAFRGEIALFNASVNLIALVVGFTGGASIVYLTARDPSRAFLRRLLGASYAFCVLVPLALGLGSSLVGQPLGREAPLVVSVAVVNSMLVVHICVLLSGSAVWQASLLEFLRPLCLVALAAAIAVTRGFRTPGEFYVAWCVAATLAFLLSIPFVAGHYLRLTPASAGAAASSGEVVRHLLGFGFLAQASNVVQFLNYRSLFFALERHAGIAAVGLFSTAVALAEVLWIPANSLAAMTLNRVSRSSQDPETRPFVLRMSRLALMAMLAVGALAAIVPVGWITALLGKDFAAVRSQLVGLLPGVIAIGMAVIASAYNAGLGLYSRNLLAALAGLLLTGLGFVLLVPRLGSAGAIIAMNASYVVTSAWLMVGLGLRERVRLREFVPNARDVSGSATGMP